MKQRSNNVVIKLETKIKDDEHVEETTTKHVGRFFNKNDVDVLIYEEDIEELGIVRNFLTIHPHKVNIKRQGIVTMNQRFELKQATETYYEHPHGQLHMETYTDSITYESLKTTNTGKLIIKYTVRLNGQKERHHVLMLTFNKEEF